ncbi:MAG: cytochrome c oxidase subunit II [Phenylobacterium sp.]|uniref:cytochrome c oxidase subunit II n=1 Tax=Phenylobacterium sp. TaxID=1871053 RepID=UPI0025F6CBDE|nr:cytochrome c oxidase subunit II [Phenylobacterium sp.]MBI1200228.1 cytochrome c oxidase subunit II [Phenylobacterium sp.]
MSGLFQLAPPEASAHAAQVDHIFLGFLALTVLLTAPVFVLLIYYAAKYRQGRPADRTHAPSRGPLIETSWAVIPFLLAIGFFVWGTFLFFQGSRAPLDALTINVVGKQWMWKFEHPGGQREIDALHVPTGRPVRLVMTSQDVIHSLYLPALRLKQDVLPGRYTSLWFNADRPGVYAIRCAEFCGFDHSVMGGRFIVMRPEAYARWLAQAGTDGSLADQGFKLFRAHGCSGCHSDQSTRRAPALAGLYGRATPLEDGRIVTADDQYLRDSILYPARDVAAGYAPIMPTFAGQLSEAEVLRLVAYLKSLGPKEPAQ